MIIAIEYKTYGGFVQVFWTENETEIVDNGAVLTLKHDGVILHVDKKHVTQIVGTWGNGLECANYE